MAGRGAILRRSLTAVVLAAAVLPLGAARGGSGGVDTSRMELTFADEFDRFDRRSDWRGPGKWNTTFGPGRSFDTRTLPNNDEKQYYVDADFTGGRSAPLGVDPFSVEDGVLTITARRAPASVKPAIGGYGYTSGLINTRDTFSQTYGYFEMRAALPAGRGLWPAFWMLPQKGGWPPELDVVEVLGQTPKVVHTAAHSKATGKHVSQFNSHKGVNTADGFHTYGALWGPQQIVWYLDGREIFRARTPDDMHQPMYLLANLAVGGKWPGPPDAATPFPAKMRIDYIRAYRLEPERGAAGR